MIRPATLEDIDALVAIENRSFETDRLSRRSFRYLLTKANAETLVADDNGHILGYATVLFNMGTSLARLYSFAVDPAFRSKGVGSQLLTAVEKVARDNDSISMRLEIRKDNARGIKLYESMGYKLFGIHTDYYEDHMEALRYEKRLVPQLEPDIGRVPYYNQTLEFTCGPSALLMAMKALDPDTSFTRRHELQLWRESTTIYMTSGHGGCDPYGMALAAYRRGFDVEVYVNEIGTLFIDSVRSEEKKEVIRLVQEDFISQIQQLPIRLHTGALTVEELQEKFNEGAIPIVLISSYRIYKEKFPHWVVVTGFDERYIYVHDSYVDIENGKTSIDCISMPILKKDFQRMARYGKAGQKAALIIRKRQSKK